MKAAIITPGRDISDVLKHLNTLDPDFKPEVWPDIPDPLDIEAALIWKAPEDILSRFKNLKLICSFGAGVDHLIFQSWLPESVMVTRLVDEDLSKNVSRYCLMAILAHEKSFQKHILNKVNVKWEWREDLPKPVIGVVGLGEIGKQVCKDLINNGYQVNGYSRSEKVLENVNSYSGGKSLEDFLHSSDVLVNILPLTEKTTGFYNLELFTKCKPGTYFINVGRGQQVIDKDLIQAIDKGYLSGAVLDVFHEEPLPQDHPFWRTDHITITPHIAGITTPVSAATQFYENYRRFKEGKSLLNFVDKSRGY